MKVYHMVVARDAAERMGDYSTRKEYKSKKQGAAPAGYICIGVCGYHEEPQKPKKQKRSRNKIYLCEHCIEAIRSHGEKVYEGDVLPDMGICEWCDEEDILYDCEF